MKSPVLAFAVLFLIGGFSTAKAADNNQPGYLIVIPTGNAPNSAGGVAGIPFKTMDGCNAAKAALGGGTSSGTAVFNSFCVTDPGPIGAK
jgi:hypothetical protein